MIIPSSGFTIIRRNDDISIFLFMVVIFIVYLTGLILGKKTKRNDVCIPFVRMAHRAILKLQPVKPFFAVQSRSRMAMIGVVGINFSSDRRKNVFLNSFIIDSILVFLHSFLRLFLHFIFYFYSIPIFL